MKTAHRLQTLVLLWCLSSWLAPVSPAAARRGERLDLQYTQLALPGPPAAILTTDLNGDGHQDLVVMVAFTEWDQVGIEEITEMDDVEGLVEVLTIVPALADRRQLHIFLADGAGGYRAAGEALALDSSVLSLEYGPEGSGVVALTDQGLSVLRWLGTETGPAVELQPWIEDPPILANTGIFMPNLNLAHDLDGDGVRDLLFPAQEAAAVYLAADFAGRPQGLTPEPASRLKQPTDRRTSRSSLVRDYPLPEVRDVDGDGLPELLFADPEEGWQRFHVMHNQGEGQFASPVVLHQGERKTVAELEAEEKKEETWEQEEGVSVTLSLSEGSSVERVEAEEEPEGEGGDEIAFFGDLDGDGRAEYVTLEGIDRGADGLREEMREAKEPLSLYRLFRSDDALAQQRDPYQQFRVRGYGVDIDQGDSDDSEIRIPGGFQDLNGDGRQDLISLTLDFSLMQAVRILTVRSISIGLDFHVWCQQDDGSFQAVSGLDLSGRFRLNLNNLRLGHLSQFSGDFDADGKADFVQLGRGREVTIHRGREGCSYPATPDLTLKLKEAPRDLGLVKIEDFDADGLSDLLVIQPQRSGDAAITPAVRLDFYLSGGDP